MSDIYRILEDLASTSKRTEKLKILEANKDNQTLQRVLVQTLDPYISYYIRKIPSFSTDESSVMNISVFLDHLHEFSDRVVTGNAAVSRLTELLSSLSPEDAEVAIRIIRQDLRCGVADSTVNKVWNGLIPTYPCELGKAYDEKTITSIVYPAFSQIKADGMRANAFYQKNKSGNWQILIRGRSGKFVDLLGCLDDPLLELGSCQDKEIVLDGELIVLEKDGKSVMPRKKGNGILNKAIRGTISQEECERVRFRIWDMLTLAEFNARVSDTMYKDRFLELSKLIDGDDIWCNKYELIECKLVNSFKDAMNHYADALSRKEEGIVLKNINIYWEGKRSTDIIKFKAEKECELRVIGYNEGTVGTKNEGKLGSLVCASDDNMVEVSISGFPDDLREEIYQNFDEEWLDAIVTVKYNERIASKDSKRQGVDSLFLPRFIEKRSDKSVADSSDQIK